jgi:hypothetical protein
MSTNASLLPLSPTTTNFLHTHSLWYRLIRDRAGVKNVEDGKLCREVHILTVIAYPILCAIVPYTTIRFSSYCPYYSPLIDRRHSFRTFRTFRPFLRHNRARPSCWGFKIQQTERPTKDCRQSPVTVKDHGHTELPAKDCRRNLVTDYEHPEIGSKHEIN